MQRSSVAAFVAGAVLGGAAGLGLSLWALTTGSTGGSGFLHDFSFQEAAPQAGHSDWELVEDKTYSPFPPLGKPAGVARRIVAQASMAGEKVEPFARQFDGAMAKALARSGAQQTGEVRCDRSRTRPVEGGGPARSVLQLPRYYYRIGPLHGVVDPWLIAQGGEVTLIVCIAE
jgi:hypothetical protein